MNERSFTKARSIRESDLLGFDAVHLLAGRQSAICETGGSNSFEDERAWRSAYHQRFHLRGSVGWSLSQGSVARGRRFAPLVAKSGVGGHSVYAGDIRA